MRASIRSVVTAATVVLLVNPPVVTASAVAGGAHPAGWLYFVADDGLHGFELWKSDGTQTGTSMVTDVRPGLGDGLNQFGYNGFIASAGTLLFTANDGVHGHELWKSDGTADGTELVADIRPGTHGSGRCCLSTPVTLGPRVYFTANDGIHGRELWTSDGTSSGTDIVMDIRPGSLGSKPYPLLVADGALYFVADDGVHGSELWKSDGTSAGTSLVEDIAPGGADAYVGALADGGTMLYFTAFDGTRYGIWRSDGSPGGTAMLHDLGSSYPIESLAAQGTLFLSTRGPDGDQLWSSDGTSSGTTLVRDFTKGRSCPAEQLTSVGQHVLFNVGIPRFGEELWITDGTWAGTSIVSDIWPGRPRYPAFDEGCQFGPRNLTEFRDHLIFSTDDGIHGTELWRSDGTAAGTVLVSDILPGVLGSLPGGSGGGYSGPFAEGAGMLAFEAYDVTHGGELWRTDGTTAGTVLVEDIRPGSTGSFPAGFLFVPS